MQNLQDTSNLKTSNPENPSISICNRTVIEIMTPWGHSGNHFEHVANYFKVNYYRVDQETEHGEVDIEKVCQVLEKCECLSPSPTISQPDLSQ